MEKFKKLANTSFIGGLVVLLPVALLIMVFNWVYKTITNIIQPITNVLLRVFEFPEFMADAVIIMTFVAICFALGLMVKTNFGKFLHEVVEEKFLKNLPIYSVIKEIIVQFVGDKKSPFSTVATAQIFGNSTLVTVFITDESEEYYTVFMPTGPNPTSGNIYHLPKGHVHIVDIPVETAMKSIISCGVGSSVMFDNKSKDQL